MRKTEYNPQAINFTSAFEPQTIDSQGMLGLHDLVRYTKLLGVSELEFSDDISMRKFKSKLEKHILEGEGVPVALRFEPTEAKRRRASV